ncbi:MAG: thioredoxin family protein [Minwuia sp.]|nr:thioredoxin family protein [Minwuia sp.]
MTLTRFTSPFRTVRRAPRLAVAMALLWLFLPMATQAAEPRTELVMFELGTCIYCAVWNDAVGRDYGETTLGQRAPLRRVDLRHHRPDDLQHVTGVRMTPTFVLLHGGQEVGRILGYIDSRSFWQQLQALMWQVPARAEKTALSVPAHATE